MRRGWWRLPAFCAALWVAFSSVGISMHRACRDAAPNRLGWVDVGGYDSEGYVRLHTNAFWMFSVNHRHPLVGFVTAPVTALGSTVAKELGKEAGCRAVLCAYAFFGAVSFLLFWLTLARCGVPFPSRVAASALWLSFAQTWIVAGIDETFGLSELLLVGTLLMVAVGVRDVRAWVTMCVVTGGVTVTNGVKPLLAWVAGGNGWVTLRRIPRRLWLWAAVGVGAVTVLAAGALAVKWSAWAGGFGLVESIRITIREIAAELPEGQTTGMRLWYLWNSFLCEPIVLHGSIIGQNVVSRPYGSFLPHAACVGALAFAGWGAVRSWRLPVVRAALAMVTVDVVLHVVCGWGNAEGQIYCAHWFWILPLLAAFLPRKAAVGVVALALFVAVQNLTLIFGL